MELLVVLPVILPLACAALAFLAMRRPVLQRALGALGTAGLLGAGLLLLRTVWREGTLVVHVGGWPAPFGIAFVSDTLSAALVLVTGLVGFAVALYSLGELDALGEQGARRERAGYWPLVLALLGGVNGAFLAGDLFNLYVWFEVLLLASFALLALGGSRAELEGAVKYLVLSLLSSTVFLTAVGLLYGATGALNLAELSLRLPLLASPRMGQTLSMLLLVAFGLKAAIFPFFAWLPPSYPTPPPALSALFAGLLTKVGVYALIRTFTQLFPGGSAASTTALLWIAGLTMVTGVLGAAAQGDMRRILSFHIVSQIGYMVLGLALGTSLAISAAVFYLLHHIVTKTNLFLVSGLVRALRGTEELGRLGGLFPRRTALALLFGVSALSLAGIPPLSGFWAKLLVFRAGLAAGEHLLVGVAAAVGLLTIFSMAKVWNEGFWGAQPEGAAEREHLLGRGAHARMLSAIALLAAVTVVLGLGAGGLLALSERVASELGDPAGYARAVLERRP